MIQADGLVPRRGARPGPGSTVMWPQPSTSSFSRKPCWRHRGSTVSWVLGLQLCGPGRADHPRPHGIPDAEER